MLWARWTLCGRPTDRHHTSQAGEFFHVFFSGSFGTSEIHLFGAMVTISPPSIQIAQRIRSLKRFKVGFPM